MKRNGADRKHWLATLALSVLISAVPAAAQLQQSSPQDRDSELTRQQLAGFDQFLDNHPELAQQLHKDPSLVKNEEFVENHPDLQRYLRDHPGVREEFTENPRVVMGQEQRYDRREDRDRDGDVTRNEMSNMDRFMDRHPEIAEQLRKDPSLVNNQEFVENHPALQKFLTEHPELREEFKENPRAFMHDENRFDRREDARDHDVNRGELANMDRFMDRHPEIAEQLRKDPSLVNNKEFVEGHPALQQFLATHPGVREEYKENPNGFMRDERGFDRREDNRMGRDRDLTRSELSSFNGFLEDHRNISSELTRNPALATNQEYLENHAELRNYLQENPKVKEELSENPQSFLKSAQTFEGPKGASKLPLPDPKSK